MWTTRRRRTWRPAGSCRSTIGPCSRCRSSWWATCCHWCWYASFTFACSSGCGARTASAPRVAAEGNESPGWSSSSLASSPSVGVLYRLVFHPICLFEIFCHFATDRNFHRRTTHLYLQVLFILFICEYGAWKYLRDQSDRYFPCRVIRPGRQSATSGQRIEHESFVHFARNFAVRDSLRRKEFMSDTGKM